MYGLSTYDLLLLGVRHNISDFYFSYRLPFKLFSWLCGFLFSCYLVAVPVVYYSSQHSVHKGAVGTDDEFQHEQDSRTTNIINYLTGRGELPESERLPLYRQYIWSVLHNEDMEVPQDFHLLTREELDALAVLWFRTTHPDRPQDAATLQKEINGLFEEAVRPPLEGFTANAYDNIWGLIEDVGAPKIRWAAERDEFPSRFLAYSANERRAFYSPVDNTIYITYQDSVNALLNETGHAYQFRQSLGSAYISTARLSWSTVSAFVGSGFSIEVGQQLYRRNYRDPNSLEGEAHGRIKEMLLSRHGLRIVDENVPLKN